MGIIEDSHSPAAAALTDANSDPQTRLKCVVCVICAHSSTLREEETFP